MQKRALISAAFVLAFTVGGCGTLLNMNHFAPYESGGQAYGGVQTDVEILHGWAKAAKSDDSTGLRVCRCSAAAWVAAVDLPLSAVGDTVTLPLTTPRTLGFGRLKLPVLPPESLDPQQIISPPVPPLPSEAEHPADPPMP
jgi:uncharacterized protein YceK